MKANMMKRAHQLAKGMVGDYRARMSLALRLAWKELKELQASKKELRRLIISGDVSLKDLTGYSYEELKNRGFKDVEKYLKKSGYYYGKTSWHYRFKMTEEQMTAFVAGAVEHELHEAEYEEKAGANQESLVNQYLKAIEWLASQVSDERGKEVLRRAWKKIKTYGLNHSINGLFEVQGLRRGEVFTANGLKESLKLKGKRVEDF